MMFIYCCISSHNAWRRKQHLTGRVLKEGKIKGRARTPLLRQRCVIVMMMTFAVLVSNRMDYRFLNEYFFLGSRWLPSANSPRSAAAQLQTRRKLSEIQITRRALWAPRRRRRTKTDDDDDVLIVWMKWWWWWWQNSESVPDPVPKRREERISIKMAVKRQFVWMEAFNVRIGELFLDIICGTCLQCSGYIRVLCYLLQFIMRRRQAGAHTIIAAIDKYVSLVIVMFPLRENHNSTHNIQKLFTTRFSENTLVNCLMLLIECKQIIGYYIYLQLTIKINHSDLSCWRLKVAAVFRFCIFRL